ncbi:MAG TPA: ABC transporter permease [Puia sp.]|uniref:ABC transporter permease n=1 Tax=Puia sp. TaxID=2045100 RepID=UPI002C677FE4|nr:ABC transporter permease [Puia sp.]HVU95987.1 ABC transporter permease [Puia sp.]
MGQLKATLVLSKYSLLATLRSPTSVVFSIAFPIFFIIIFGSLVGDKGGPIKVAVSPGCDTANPVYKTVEGLAVIRLVKGLTAAEIAAEMRQGTIGTELNIVSDGGLLPHFRVTLRGTDSNSRGMSLLRPVIGAALREMDRRVFPRNPSLGELSVVQAPGHLHKTIDFVLPGQLGFSLLMAGVFGSSFLLFNLRQNFVLKRLRATPVRKRSIIGGEMLSRLFFHVIGFMIMIGLGYFAFGFTLVHGWATVVEMLVFSLFGLGIFMGIGFIISGVVQNEHSVTPVANTLTLPQILLCGLFFPIESYPPWLQHICNVLPLTFFVDGLRDIAFDGLHIWELPAQVGGLVVWTVVIGVWAVKAFKWE